MFDQATLSSTLGALSIVTWLGAQSPQLYENYKNGSVEGLALPFLISWFWGDFTNFVGCVLTHQLPFQTYLATYFLFVDVALVSQYYYYSRQKPPHDLPPLSESFPYAQGSGPHHPPFLHPRKPSGRRSRSSRSRSGYSKLHHGQQHPPHAHPATHTPTSEGDPMAQSFMSTRSTAPGSSAYHARDNSHQSQLPFNYSSTSLYTTASMTASNDEPPPPPSPVVAEPRGRTLTRHIASVPAPGPGARGGGGQPFFDPTSLATIYGSPSTGTGAGSGYLEQTLQTRLPHHAYAHLHHHHQQHAAPPPVHSQHHAHESSGRGSSSRSRPPPPSRRATGIAFLSVGLLFTLGRSAGGPPGAANELLLRRRAAGAPVVRAGATAWSAGRRDGDDLWRRDLPVVVAPDDEVVRRSTAFPLDVSVTATSDEFVTTTTNPPSGSSDPDREGSDAGEEGGGGDGEGAGEGPDWERIVGRTSAWLCTTLYLTSRLPQIWRNFRRRSVEGLAMTLFFFAFVGNSLYVASILTNPLARVEPGYLIESTPYLLGSGGTLMFDLMIMVQAWMYTVPRSSAAGGGGAGKRSGHHRRKTGDDDEEAASLLRGGDGFEEDGGGDGSERTTTTRRARGRTSAGGGGGRGTRSGRSSRDSSTSYGRSISSRRTVGSTTTTNGGISQSLALSMTRSRSTDVGLGRTSRGRDVSASSSVSSASRAERGILDDREFEWDGGVEDPPLVVRQHPPPPTLSRGSSFSSGGVRHETIAEAGESSVTVRE
ncbi:hypothetical protein JCM11491_006390 [Sporobolomyces phaffii]